ncbi:hypothetical protein BJY04DRAFT_221314 [Aspergillus karnatakaensis]|uniref:uncharacterized protein n=1 Tax=Aspergillus karnatakaensis TaxID=1810916 RepID=UPI003CCD3CD0
MRTPRPLTALLGRPNLPYGLVIYRTTYSPVSETHFPTILQVINALFVDDMKKHDDQDEYQPVIMDDQTRFDGLSLDDVRKHFQSYLENRDRSQSEMCTDFCVVIDEDVVWRMRNVNPVDDPAVYFDQYWSHFGHQWWVKTVNAHWGVKHEDDDEDEDGDGEQEPWFKCSVFAIWGLWDDMSRGLAMSTVMSFEGDVYYL